MRRNPWMLVLISTACLFSFCGHRQNAPFIGSWKSLSPPSDNKGFDFTIRFSDDNSFRVDAVGRGSSQVILGGYEISDSNFSVWDITDKPLAFCNIADTGRYIYAAHGDSLLFRTISDNCERRKLAFEIGLKRR